MIKQRHSNCDHSIYFLTVEEIWLFLAGRKQANDSLTGRVLLTSEEWITKVSPCVIWNQKSKNANFNKENIFKATDLFAGEGKKKIAFLEAIS